MATKGNVTLIKSYFERADAQAPEGGRKFEMSELKELPPEARAELGALCAVELGEEIPETKAA